MKFQIKIKRFKFFITILSRIFLKKDNKKMINKKNNIKKVIKANLQIINL